MKTLGLENSILIRLSFTEGEVLVVLFLGFQLRNTKLLYSIEN